MTQTTDLERSDLGMKMLAAWMNVRVDQLPPENKAHLNSVTMAAWQRVGEVAAEYAADELARLRAENEALKRELASRPQWAGGQSPVTCGSGGIGYRAIKPTSEAHAAVLEDLARRIDDE